MSGNLAGALLAAVFVVTSVAGAAEAQQPKPLTMATLLDRMQIEDLLTRYYYDLSKGKAHELSEYFTEDALLDVDGTLAKGRAAIAKLYATEAAVTGTRIATQVFGGYGFMEEYPVARFYRDAKILEIGEGTSEVQRMLIARGLGLPVE